MGIATVALYSEADATRCTWRWPTRRSCSARAQPRSYSSRQDHRGLQGDRREAVHPGYGFLSENEAFAGASRRRASSSSGRSTTASPMGDKIASKKLATRAKVSTIRAGTTPSVRGARRGDRARHRLPVMIKPARPAGAKPARGLERQGRVRGLHLCRKRGEGELRRRRVFIEKYIEEPRTSRSRCSATRTATWSTSTSASQPAASPPEGDRGGAVAVHQRRHAQGDGRAGRGAGESVRYRARHGRVRGRQGTKLLLLR